MGFSIVASGADAGSVAYHLVAAAGLAMAILGARNWDLAREDRGRVWRFELRARACLRRVLWIMVGFVM